MQTTEDEIKSLLYQIGVMNRIITKQGQKIRVLHDGIRKIANYGLSPDQAVARAMNAEAIKIASATLAKYYTLDAGVFQDDNKE